MATLPSVPAFVTGETPSIAKLNQLAYCVSFLNSIPAFGVFTVSSQPIPNSSNTALSWTKVTDRDGGFNVANPTRYTAQTPGYYQFTAAASFGVLTASGNFSVNFLVTTGAGNPGGPGLTQSFGYADCNAAPSVSILSTSELSPYLYPGDYVELYVFQATTFSQNVTAALQVTIASLGP